MISALVTGSTGFCGARLVEFLELQGLHVDRVSPNRHAPGVRQVDFSDAEALAQVLRQTRPAYIFHLSGASGDADLATFVRVNCLHAAVLLDAIALAELDDVRVLMVGSAAEYGPLGEADLPAAEGGPTLPTSAYGITKLAQTRLALSRAPHGLRITVARPSNIVGPGMSPHLALPSFAAQLALIERGERPPILEVGNLDAVRDFIDIADAVEIFWKLVNAPAAYGRVVNVASGQGVRLGDALGRLQEAFGTDVELRVAPGRGGSPDVPVFYADRRRLDATIVSHRNVPLPSSIRALADYARRQATLPRTGVTSLGDGGWS